MEVKGVDSCIGCTLRDIGSRRGEGRVRATGAMPLVDVRGYCCKNNFGVGGGSARFSGDLGVLENAVDRIRGPFEERGEAAGAGKRGCEEGV